MVQKAVAKNFVQFCSGILLLVLLCPEARAQEEKKGSIIQLLGADVTEFDLEMVDADRLIGNVRFKQDNLYMDCDSAYFYHKQNKIEAFGNIYIRQQDTLNLWGDYLQYDGDKRIAYVQDNVKLKDNKMTLTTNALMYNLDTKTAFYTTGGHIVNGEDQLYSRVGNYYSRSKSFEFKDSVRLINPEYTMDSDTLHYNTNTKVATFLGPTFIRSEENTIFCHYGWYDTHNNTSEFSNGAYIQGKENKLVADSMVYNRNTGIGRAFRHIVLIDTVQDIKILGEKGVYNRFHKTTEITGMPMTVVYMDDDSMFMMADTMIDRTDTSNEKRVLYAFHNTRLYKSDMQGHCDSLTYEFSDSLIRMFYDPVLWSDSNQITGDTLVIYLKNHKVDKMDVIQDAFIAGIDGPERYNQIKGRDMEAFFKDGKLHRVYVNGNGQSVYYAKEDSLTYTGVNSIVCSEMLIRIDSNKVTDISFYTRPEGTIYPLGDFPEASRLLPGFNWRGNDKPVLEDFTKRYGSIIASRSDQMEEVIQMETVAPRTEYPPMEKEPVPPR